MEINLSKFIIDFCREDNINDNIILRIISSINSATSLRSSSLYNSQKISDVTGFKNLRGNLIVDTKSAIRYFYYSRILNRNSKNKIIEILNKMEKNTNKDNEDYKVEVQNDNNTDNLLFSTIDNKILMLKKEIIEINNKISLYEDLKNGE